MTRLIQIYVLATILNVAILSLLYSVIPPLRPHMIREDHFLENLTAVLFLVGFLLGLIFISRLKGTSYPRAYLLIPLIALVCFLEEVSYGQRFLHLPSPRINLPGAGVRGFAIDSLHDLLGLPTKLYGTRFLYALAVVFGAVVLLILRTYGIAGIFTNSPPVGFALVFMGFLFIGMILDIRHGQVTLLLVTSGAANSIERTRDLLQFVEELSDMNAAFALVFASLSIRQSRPHAEPS